MCARSKAGLALAALLALAGCGLGGRATGPSVTGATTSTLLYTPGAATGAPTTAAGVVTTAPPVKAVTTSGPTTTQPRPLVGPPLNLVKLVESPMTTRNEPVAAGAKAYRDGVLVKASNAAYDRSFVFSAFVSTFEDVRPAPGWAFTILSRDRQWTPASCGASANTFVGHRWEVYVDAGPTQPDAPLGGPTAQPANVQLVSFDVTTATFMSYLDAPNTVTWFSNNLVALDDHTVGILFDPDRTAQQHTQLVLRRIDLAAARASDERIVLPPNSTYTYPYLGSDGSITLYQDGSDQVLRRPAGGAFTVLPLDAITPQAAVDGFRLDRGAAGADPDTDIPLVDTTGKAVAQIHPWRFAVDGQNVGLFGFSKNRAYFGALPTKVEEGGQLNLGVYDIATATWDWVFDPASPIFHDPQRGFAFFVAGTS